LFSWVFRGPVGAPPVRVPFALIDALFADVPRVAPRPPVSRARLEVTERENAYEVRADLPGVNKDDITVDVDGAWVAIRAKASTQAEKKDGEKLLYTERQAESFARTFELPRAVDLSASTARFENGVLTLTLPKQVIAPKVTRLAVQ